MAKHIWDLTEKEVEILLELADFSGYKITRLKKDTDYAIVDCLVVYAESEWNDGETDYMQEDEIVRLFPASYENSCDFYPGFKIANYIYVQWALWCGILDFIDFDNIKHNIE